MSTEEKTMFKKALKSENLSKIKPLLSTNPTLASIELDNDGNTALHLIVLDLDDDANSINIINEIWKVGGVKINAKEKVGGQTALHWASLGGKINQAKKLLKLGANKNILDYADADADDLCCEWLEDEETDTNKVDTIKKQMHSILSASKTKSPKAKTKSPKAKTKSPKAKTKSPKMSMSKSTASPKSKKKGRKKSRKSKKKHKSKRIRKSKRRLKSRRRRKSRR